MHPSASLPCSFLCGSKLMRSCRHSLSFQLTFGHQIMSTHQNAASLRRVRGKVGKEINTRAGVQSVQRLAAPSGSVSCILRSTRQRGRLHADVKQRAQRWRQHLLPRESAFKQFPVTSQNYIILSSHCAHLHSEDIYSHTDTSIEHEAYLYLYFMENKL